MKLAFSCLGVWTSLVEVSGAGDDSESEGGGIGQ